jgi:HSP20 family protein
MRSTFRGSPESDIAIEVKDDHADRFGGAWSNRGSERKRLLSLRASSGTFARAVRLPQGVDQEQITACYENGVLEIRVPKPEQAQPRKIELSRTVEA